jgi:transposase
MQTPSVVLNIGADVAKDEIVVACSEGSFPVREVANRRAALLAFLKGLPAGSRIGVEATGSYHELFADAAHALGFRVFLLNPKDTRHYAKAVGLRGKTDRVDAELIARMVAHEHTKLHAWIPPTPQQREIDRLIKRRATLIALREAVEMSLYELGGFADDLAALRTRFKSAYRAHRPASQDVGRGESRAQTELHAFMYDLRHRPGRRHRSGQYPGACTPEERGCFRRLHRPGPATG